MNCELIKEFRLRNANVAISYNVLQLQAGWGKKALIFGLGLNFKTQKQVSV